MKPIKMFGLAALAVLMAMAFVGASSAMATTTQLCNTDTAPCGSPVTHIHKVAVLIHWLSPLGNVLCDLFLTLSNSVGGLGAPQIVHSSSTYSGCKRKKIFGGEENCTFTELNGPAEVTILRTGHETASVTEEGEVEVKCGSVIECTYNGENLIGTAKGPLLSTQTNGEVTLSEQTMHAVKGAFCPETAKLDLTTTSSTAIYISS